MNIFIAGIKFSPENLFLFSVRPEDLVLTVVEVESGGASGVSYYRSHVSVTQPQTTNVVAVDKTTIELVKRQKKNVIL